MKRRTLVLGVAALLLGGCATSPEDFTSLRQVTDELNQQGWSCPAGPDEAATKQTAESAGHAIIFCGPDNTAIIWASVEARRSGAQAITLSQNYSSPPRSVSPQVAEWMQRVNTPGSPYQYGPEDAASSCMRLDEAGDKAAWEVVGDDRLLWAGRLLCTKHKAAADRGEKGVRGGTYTVGGEGSEHVAPGTYVTEPGVENCYWERVSKNGGTLGNAFVSFAPEGATVTIKASDGGFKSEGCGVWIPKR